MAVTTTAAAATTTNIGATAGQDVSGVKTSTRTTTITRVSTTKVNVPLTTVFTAPSSCARLPYTSWNNNGTITWWKNAFTLTGVPGASCYPESFWLRQASGTTMEYSPGVCPTGYHAAQIVQSGSTAPVTSFCCPSGMAFSNGAGCYSTVSTSTNVVIDQFTSKAVTTPFIAWDWHIQVVWASSDLSLFSPASAPLLAVASSASTIRSANGASVVPNASAQGVNNNGTSTTSDNGGTTTTTAAAAAGSSGLSGGAIAGIVVGALAGVALLLGLVFFLLRRRRLQKHDSVPPGYTPAPYTTDAKVAPEQHPYAGAYAPAPTHAPEGQRGINELPAAAANEYRPELAGGAYGTTAELATKSPAAELDGGYYAPQGQSPAHTYAPTSARTPIDPTNPTKG